MSNFKVDDIVVCIDDSNSFIDIELNKIYTISKLISETNSNKTILVSLKELNSSFGFYSRRFITLKEYRKLKINKLNEGF